MKKISRREIIILCVTLAVFLYGVYEFLPRGTPETVPAAVDRHSALQQTNALIGTLAATLKDGERARLEALIIEKAHAPWSRDPFFVGISAPVEPLEDEPELLPVIFAYTGYLEMGERRMAIINGVDYQAGDDLEEPGFVLRSVTPRHVVIAYERGRRELVVPFIEE